MLRSLCFQSCVHFIKLSCRMSCFCLFVLSLQVFHELLEQGGVLH